MAYNTRDKFDDPPKSVQHNAHKFQDNELHESMRRAIQSITNRVIWGGSGGTHSTSLLAGVGTGGTAGVQIVNRLSVLINGRMGTVAEQNNIFLPAGTQGSNTWVKYLIAAKFGTAATVVAGNEGASATAARLPSCPDGYVAVGYLEYQTTSGAYIRFGGGTAGGNNVLSGNTNATCGTVSAFVDLVHMPLDES